MKTRELLSTDNFKKIFPKCDHNKWYLPLTESMEKYKIDSVNSIGCFLATIDIESNGLTAFEENLNYSAALLLKVFPGYFRSKDDTDPKNANKRIAEDYARQPEKIANVVYARAKMFNDKTGYGYKYRGRGILQITFFANYQEVGKALGVDLVGNPDLMLDPHVSCDAACYFFTSRGCLKHSEKGDIRSVSGIINAGSASATTIHGLDQRTKKFLEVIKLLNG